MGSFAAQQYVLEHSREIDGLILSGSGALDGLALLAGSAPPGSNSLNAPFEPARTPFDWLSRDNAVVDAFINDPMCFGQLQPTSFASFLAAAPRLSDPASLRQIRADLPIYLFSGSDDPVGQHLKAVETLLERYRQAGVHDICHDFYLGGRHEMLNEINGVKFLKACLTGCLRSWTEFAARHELRAGGSLLGQYEQGKNRRKINDGSSEQVPRCYIRPARGKARGLVKLSC